ncbi:MAG: sensor histidine kinase [Chloroflexi bacterium]|nr:MAG: sensor histidine kinase [Chloroflexota bacterium]
MDGPFGDHLRHSALKSIAVIPLLVREQILGFFGLEMREERRNISREENHLLNIFSTDIAQILLNANLFEQSKSLVAAEERERLARDLHDSVAQAIYGISLYANAIQMARQSNKQDVINEHIGELVKLAREALADMRLLIFQLRPPILEEEGLLAALQSRLDSVETRSGIKARLETRGTFTFTPDQEIELYRIALEILNNILKHAQANEVKLHLIGEEGCFRMVIEDNGVGFEPEVAEQAGGQGLRNIRERAAKIGAACAIHSAPGKGAKIALELKFAARTALLP